MQTFKELLRNLSNSNRDNFTEATRRILAERVAWHCTMCLKTTIGPHSDKTKSLKTGHAAHILAAASRGPRYDEDQTVAERRSISNGIWLCKDCGDLIDKDSARYDASYLRDRRLQVETAIDQTRSLGFMEVVAALTALAGNTDFAFTIAAQNTLSKNRDWLANSFSHKPEAKRYFGQSLAPGASHPYPVLTRDAVSCQIKEWLRSQNQDVLAVLGEEGVGKSWVVAQALLTWDDRPHTVFMSAKDIRPSATYNNIESQIIDRLIAQSTDKTSDPLRKLWEAQFERWQSQDGSGPNLIVCIDGINENGSVDWPRWIDGAVSDLRKLGGNLIVTDRQKHFNQDIKIGISSPVRPISVEEWSIPELEILLSGKDVDTQELDAEVLASLRNPRLLGIALSLNSCPLQALTKQRLLFEYIRHCQGEGRLGEGPLQFARRLADHAEDVRSKANAQQSQNSSRYVVSELPGVEPFRLSNELLHASTSQFYIQLPTNGHYKLSEDGLNIALGIGIISSLREANADQSVSAELLERLLEPIAALDMTADIIFAALQFAAANDEVEPIQTALLGQFLQLQNIDKRAYPALLNVIRRSPQIALNALYEIDRRKERPTLKDWLMNALRELRDDDGVWTAIQKSVDCWLRLYTLEPEPRVASFGQTPEEGQKRLQAEAAKIQTKVSSLTPSEIAFQKVNCIRNDSLDCSTLHLDAFLLLSGKPLTEMAPALAAWAFNHGLNASWDAPDEDYLALVRFNTVDWPETEVALRKAVQGLLDQLLSQTGRWCLAILWAAISTDHAQKEREELLDILRPDRHEQRGGSLREKLSATDPCDPSASPPNDLTFLMETAEKQDFSQIYCGRSGKDILLSTGEPALSRWLPQLAMETERRLITCVLDFDLEGLALAMPQIASESALLRPTDIIRLQDIARTYSRRNRGESGSENNEWTTEQFALLAAVPHLDGQEQFALLKSLPHPGSLLISTAEMFQHVDEISFESAYLAADESNRADARIAYLCFAAYTKTELSRKVQECLVKHALSDTEETFLAIETLSRRGDHQAQLQFAESGWTSKQTDRSKRAERFYGSIILIKVAAAGKLDIIDMLARIDPATYNFAAEILGATIAPILAQLLTSCVSRLSTANLPQVTPPARKDITSTDSTIYPRIDIDLDDPEPATIQEAFSRNFESNAEFQARYERADQRYKAFEDDLEKLDAGEIIKNIGRAPVHLVYEHMPSEVLNWATICLRAPSSKHRQLANLAMTISSVISGAHDTIAAELLAKYEKARPTIRLTYDLRELPHDVMTSWKGVAGLQVTAFRKRRLDEAFDDQTLAENVDGALSGRQTESLQKYILECMNSTIPAVRARGLLVAGFMDEAPWIDAIFDRVGAEQGLIRHALKTARFAYDRNRWSKYWFKAMCSANSNADFWRFSRLFLKIVDFRFEYWARDLGNDSDNWQKFGPTLKSKIKNRLKKWKEERAKTFLGQKVPDERFVRSRSSG